MFFYMGKMLTFPQSLYVLENLWLSPPGKASWASRKPHRHKKSRTNVAPISIHYILQGAISLRCQSRRDRLKERLYEIS